MNTKATPRPLTAFQAEGVTDPLSRAHSLALLVQLAGREPHFTDVAEMMLEQIEAAREALAELTVEASEGAQA